MKATCKNCGWTHGLNDCPYREEEESVLDRIYKRHFEQDETVVVAGVPDVATNKEAILLALTALQARQELMQNEAIAREKQLEQTHEMLLDTISCMSISEFVVWRDERKRRPVTTNN